MDYFHGPPALLRGTTLLLPQSSLASLPQLATDLLLHTLGWTLVGSLEDRDFVPCVGGVDHVLPASPPTGFCRTVQVFQDRKREITLILTRSPVIRERKSYHLKAMRSFIESAGFKEILIVSAVDAAMRGDDGLNELTPLRYISLPGPQTALIERLHSTTPPYGPAPSNQSAVIPLIPQGGLTRSLLSALAEPSLSSTPVSALLIYAAEGDNEGAAYFLADVLVELLGLDAGEMKRDAEGRREYQQPMSWRQGLMGKELSRDTGGSMFG